MPKSNPKHNSASLTEARIEELLVDQTRVLLNAVDEKLAAQNVAILSAVDQKLAVQNVTILSAVDKRLEKLEERWLEKFNKLTTTLDKFLKRMTDMEEEFTFMKNDVNRIKAVLREKLGVSID
jgi:hypothetical protein